MSKQKKYVVLKFDTEVYGQYDTIQEAVEGFIIAASESAEPSILKRATWKTDVTDITESEEAKLNEITKEVKI